MHLMESLKSFFQIKQFQLGHFNSIRNEKVKVKLTRPRSSLDGSPKSAHGEERKVVILDMDETLIHACSASEIASYEQYRKPDLIT